MQMAGLAGLNGWRWIFIMEGIITILIGLVGYWLLVDFPDGTRQAWSFLGTRAGVVSDHSAHCLVQHYS